jgi:hypothetical protein
MEIETMARSMSIMCLVSLTGLFALSTLAGCTYENRGYDGSYAYGNYGASAYRDDYGHGYRPDDGSSIEDHRGYGAGASRRR